MKNYLFKRYIKNDLKQVKQFEFYSNGTIRFLLNRKFHRENGPARIWDGRVELEGDWFIDGTQYYTEHEYKEALEKHKRNKLGNSK